jgi:hypothetical protein
MRRPPASRRAALLPATADPYAGKRRRESAVFMRNTLARWQLSPLAVDRSYALPMKHTITLTATVESERLDVGRLTDLVCRIAAKDDRRHWINDDTTLATSSEAESRDRPWLRILAIEPGGPVRPLDEG